MASECHTSDDEDLDSRSSSQRFEDDDTPKTWRTRIQKGLDSTPWMSISFLLIITSSFFFMIETLPKYHRKNPLFWFWLETAVVIIFSVEVILRFVSTKPWWKYFKDVFNYIDLLSIVPYYFALFIFLGNNRNSDTQSVLRVLRLFRVLKLGRFSGRHSKPLAIYKIAIGRSWFSLVLLLYFVLIVISFSSAAIYYAERGRWDEEDRDYYRTWPDGTVEPSPFNSIPASLWWAMVTFSTVGYGDMFPITVIGKVIASIMMLFSIVVVSLPIAVLQAEFQKAYAEQSIKRENERIRRQIQKAMLHSQPPTPPPSLQAEEKVFAVRALNSIVSTLSFKRSFRKSSSSLSRSSSSLFRTSSAQKLGTVPPPPPVVAEIPYSGSPQVIIPPPVVIPLQFNRKADAAVRKTPRKTDHALEPERELAGPAKWTGGSRPSLAELRNVMDSGDSIRTEVGTPPNSEDASDLGMGTGGVAPIAVEENGVQNQNEGKGTSAGQSLPVASTEVDQAGNLVTVAVLPPGPVPRTSSARARFQSLGKRAVEQRSGVAVSRMSRSQSDRALGRPSGPSDGEGGRRDNDGAGVLETRSVRAGRAFPKSASGTSLRLSEPTTPRRFRMADVGEEVVQSVRKDKVVQQLLQHVFKQMEVTLMQRIDDEVKTLVKTAVQQARGEIMKIQKSA